MEKDALIINVNESETRAALLHDGQPVEVFFERPRERNLVGNIYRGRVSRVLPGMQAAFIDIGLERNGFLYVNDAVLDLEARRSNDDEESRADVRGAPVADIAEVLKAGQEILVQIQKEPLGTKGARLTRHITLPGRSLVKMPFSDHIGVSQRIETEDERTRLVELITRNDNATSGYIARTASDGVSEEDLDRDIEILEKLWKSVESQGQQGPCPRLIFSDLNLSLRVVRDLFTDAIGSVEVDEIKTHSEIRTFVESFMPERLLDIKHYQEPTPIFEKFGVDAEIDRALNRRVWLKSGGYIIIDETEALTVVDVNSGRFVGKRNLEETITQTNLEAARELAYQLRLRNIGGIIIIDFIDMMETSNQEKVLSQLSSLLERDKAKCNIIGMSAIGLVEMTRKRVRESLGGALSETCPYCRGEGRIKSLEAVGNQVFRATRRVLSQNQCEGLLLNVHSEVADYIYENQAEAMAALEATHQTSIIPVAREGYHREQFDIVMTT